MLVLPHAYRLVNVIIIYVLNKKLLIIIRRGVNFLKLNVKSIFNAEKNGNIIKRKSRVNCATFASCVYFTAL